MAKRQCETLSKQQPQKINRSHLHPLELKTPKNLLYTCNGCKEKGFGPRNRCDKCDFDLHEACTFPQILPTSSHEFFPSSTFEFFKTPPKARCKNKKRYCNACLNPINGFVYHCKKHDVDLHPCCRKLQKSFRYKDVEFKLSKKVKGECMRCKKKSLKDKGWSYSYISKCNGKECHLHVACATEMALKGYNNQSIKTVQPRSRGNAGNEKTWSILEFLIENIVSIVIGDPTPILDFALCELFAP